MCCIGPRGGRKNVKTSRRRVRLLLKTEKSNVRESPILDGNFDGLFAG